VSRVFVFIFLSLFKAILQCFGFLLLWDSLALDSKTFSTLFVGARVFIFEVILLIALLAVSKHVIVHIVSFGFEVATDGNFCAFWSPFEEQLQLLRAVHVQ
jgi:hypothetical protein